MMLTPDDKPELTTARPDAERWCGRRVTVMGLGSFGGGIGAVRWLVERGARVTVTDLRPPAELQSSLAQLADCPPHALHLGEHRVADFTETDLLVVSPAVPRENRYRQLAEAAGVAITSEMNLFWERNRGRTIGITGSNGKSTTTALCHALLAAGMSGDSGGTRRCWLGGNIGRSLLPLVDQIRPDDWVVLELSSFQLDDLAPLQPQPDIAVVTNFTPNHLDRHGTLDAYRAAKQNLVRWQRPDQVAILNADDPDVRNWPTSAKRLWFGLDEARPGEVGLGPGCEGMFARREGAISTADFRRGEVAEEFPLGDWLALPGRHNLQNALAATCAALVAGASPVAIQSAARAFTALPHRLQLVAHHDGRRFYNDSKATTPEAAQLALRAFDAPVVLLAGGYDKGIDLSGLAQTIVERRVRGVALLGQTADELARLIRPQSQRLSVPIELCPCATLDEAFAWAVGRSQSGDVILLSPGCASYDWFQNYEERGAAFTRLAQKWCGHPAPPASSAVEGSAGQVSRMDVIL